MPNKKVNSKTTSMDAHTTMRNSSMNVNQPKATMNKKSSPNTNVENSQGQPDSQTIDE